MKKLEVFVILVIFIVTLIGCNNKASSIGIIGGADGPTSVFVGEVQNKEASEAEVVSVEHEPIENNSWGITLTAKDVTPVGMTIVCTQNDHDVVGELFTGSSYSLYRYVEDEWIAVEYLPQEHEIAWTSEAWVIPLEETVEWETNWEWLYGELPQGHYKLGKGIMNLPEPGKLDTSMQFVEFEIFD